MVPAICRCVVVALLLMWVGAASAWAQQTGDEQQSSEASAELSPDEAAHGATAMRLSPETRVIEMPYLDQGMNEFGVWGGGSFSSPTLIGKAEGARFGIVGLRYARVLFAGDNGLALKYMVDAVPLAVLSYERSRFVQTSESPDVFQFERGRATASGAGVAPVGLQLNFRRSKRVQPFASASVGFIYFGETVPDERSALEPLRAGRQFNFTADFGGGVQWFTSQRRALTFGYRYHHLSNGYRGEINPGFDSNLFYAGFSFFK